MNWVKILLHILVVGGVYVIGYFGGYYFSKKYASERRNKKYEK